MATLTIHLAAGGVVLVSQGRPENLPNARGMVDGTVARIALCTLRDDDSPTLFGWVNDREQVILNAPYRPVSRVEHATWFDAVQRRPDTVIFGIRLVDGDTLIGTCQLHGIQPVHRHAELQIRIGDPAHRGHGYGTEAVRALLRFAFRDLNLHRVTLKVFATNTRAIRAYEKAGFVREGVMRRMAWIDGDYVDVVVMGVLADD